MEKLVTLIKREWGHVHKCNDDHVCGRCQVQTYCGKDCQKADWAIHHLECVGIKVKREREGDEEQEKQDAQESKKQKEVIDVDALNTGVRDVDDLIMKFLSLEDIKNLRLVSRDRNRQFFWRMQQVNRFWYRIKDADLLKTIPWLQNITHLIVACDHNQLKNAQLPAGVTHLIIESLFVGVGEWPKSLTHLTFQNEFSYPMANLPQSVTHLKFGSLVYVEFDSWPKSLTHLTLSPYFNSRSDRFPSTLTHLTFGEYFNQSVDQLPLSLTHLTFGHGFNRPVNNLPSTLTHLTFGLSFNQPVDRLPINLSVLNLSRGFNFNYPLDKLPALLKELSIGRGFHRMTEKLPQSLVRLSMYRDQREYFPNAPELIIDYYY